jgi:SAM-dependent methyltransferase
MPSYDPDWLRGFYNEYAEKEWARWDKRPVEAVKFEIHLHYLRQYLRLSDRVLEVGAGPGRFTREMAKLVDRITVGDISSVQLELNRRNAAEMGFAPSVEEWVECDICDLTPQFADESFDAVVCYGGPLSYVFDQRGQALSELLRVCRPGGRLLLSVMSLWGTAHAFLPALGEIDWAINRRIIATGDQTPDTQAGSHYCHLFRASELRAFLDQGGALVDVISASNCLTTTWEDYVESIRDDPEAWGEIIRMEIEACREPGGTGMGTHLIAVCRKPA